MEIGKFGIVYSKSPKHFYWLPQRLTFKHNPAIYRWGYWNFSWDLERQNRECREKEYQRHMELKRKIMGDVAQKVEQ